MKSLRFVALIATLLSLASPAMAQVPKGCDPEDIKLAEQAVSAANRDFRDGTESAENMLAVHRRWLQVRLCAGKIDHAAYCKSRLALFDQQASVLKSLAEKMTVEPYRLSLLDLRME